MLHRNRGFAASWEDFPLTTGDFEGPAGRQIGSIPHRRCRIGPARLEHIALSGECVGDLARGQPWPLPT
jgi:hypothetical protein